MSAIPSDAGPLATRRITDLERELAEAKTASTQPAPRPARALTELSRKHFSMRVMAFGGGTNSTAMMVGLHERGQAVDLIIFADTGGEKPHTYRAVEQASAWGVERGFPAIQRAARHTTVSKLERVGTYTTLEEDCLAKGMLPSIAYGFKGCSQKYKIEPQNKYCNSHPGCLAAWAAGEKVEKLIGYDMDEPHRAQIPEDDKYHFTYPLIEWGWGREECVEAIARAGLDQPGKSACFYCPSSKKSEIIELKLRYPDLAARAVAMEQKAAERHDTVKGLGRSFAWGDFLAADEAQQKLFPNPIITECGSCYDGRHVSEAAE